MNLPILGRDWYTTRPPRRWHRCSPVMRSIVFARLVDRCACGAIRLDGNGPWMERNTRRRK